MKPALKVVSTVSPERQALAAAIAAAKPAQAEVDEARSIADAGRDALAEAMSAVPAAERATSEAKARLIDNPAADRSALRKLRQDEIDRRDDLEIAKEVAARTELRLRDAERTWRYGADALEKAADAVIAANFELALEAAERAGREFAKLTLAAGIIASSGDQWNGDRNRMVGRVESLNPGFALRNDGAVIAAVRQEAVAPWVRARDALLIDADAPLPEVG